MATTVKMSRGNNNKAPAAGTTNDGTVYFATDTNQIFMYKGTDKYNFSTRVKGNAESTYRSGDVNITSENIGALPLTGGTLTGGVNFKTDTSVDLTNSSPNNNHMIGRVQWFDKNDTRMGEIRTNWVASTGTSRLMLGSMHLNGGVNWLYLDTAADGTNSVTVTSPSAWRSALGITDASYKNTATAPISISSAGNISMTAASSSAAGYVTTGTQSFAGSKTFLGSVTFGSTPFNVNNSGDSRFHTITVRSTNVESKVFEYQFNWQSSSSYENRQYLTLHPRSTAPSGTESSRDMFIHLGNGGGGGVAVTAGDAYNNLATQFSTRLNGLASSSSNEHLYLVADNNVMVINNAGNVIDTTSNGKQNADTHGYAFQFANGYIKRYIKATTSATWSEVYGPIGQCVDDNLIVNTSASTLTADTNFFSLYDEDAITFNGTCPLSYYGNFMITVRGNFKHIDAWTAGTSYTIGTMASPWRPYGDIYGVSSRPTDSMWVTSGGLVKYQPHDSGVLAAGKTFYFSFTYVCRKFTI